jgi:hypothetical protein
MKPVDVRCIAARIPQLESLEFMIQAPEVDYQPDANDDELWAVLVDLHKLRRLVINGACNTTPRGILGFLRRMGWNSRRRDISLSIEKLVVPAEVWKEEESAVKEIFHLIPDLKGTLYRLNFSH